MPDSAVTADAAFDDPVAQRAFTTWETAAGAPRLARSHLRLSGLWCAGCADIVEAALRRDAGVVDAAVQCDCQKDVPLGTPALDCT